MFGSKSLNMGLQRLLAIRKARVWRACCRECQQQVKDVGLTAGKNTRDQAPQRSAAVCTGASHRAFAWPSSTDTVIEAPAMSRAVT